MNSSSHLCKVIGHCPLVCLLVWGRLLSSVLDIWAFQRFSLSSRSVRSSSSFLLDVSGRVGLCVYRAERTLELPVAWSLLWSESGWDASCWSDFRSCLCCGRSFADGRRGRGENVWLLNSLGMPASPSLKFVPGRCALFAISWQSACPCLKCVRLSE